MYLSKYRKYKIKYLKMKYSKNSAIASVAVSNTSKKDDYRNLRRYSKQFLRIPILDNCDSASECKDNNVIYLSKVSKKIR